MQELVAQQEMRGQAKQDVKGIQEKVAEELQKLHNLLDLMLQGIQARLRKQLESTDTATGATPASESEEDGISYGSIAQEQMIALLELNLEQLTKVNKQVSWQ